MTQLASFTAIYTGGILSGLLIYAFFKEPKIIAWEDNVLFPFLRRLWQRICRFIRRRMKSNARFIAWLNKPVKHGKPDADFIAGQIKVFGDVWRL
ncbi:MAG: hypothetical protein E7410_07445 [Ruminococcaceae bacterium]|nr:hypothetical protein [Oscillospiraceae bacterium]